MHCLYLPSSNHATSSYRGALTASKKKPRQSGAPPFVFVALGLYFLLEPEPDDEPGDVLWLALGWLEVDERPLCEGD